MGTSFSVGGLTVDRIVEMEQPYVEPSAFFPSIAPGLIDENRSWLEGFGLDAATGKLVLCFQSYVVRTPHHIVLIDSCIGNDKDRPGRPLWHKKTDPTFMRRLAAVGLSVEDIDVVMCTHLHLDHVGWNTRLENGRWVPTFPKARYLFSKIEYDYWAAEHQKTPSECIADSVIPIVEAKRAEFIRSDFGLDDHVTLLPTPGHTPDHFAVCLGRGGMDAVVTGDLIHSPIQMRYPELASRPDYDPKQAGATRRSFMERYCDTKTLCCTAHFPSPSVGHVTRWGDGFRFNPVAA
jgi:glyoxylase-like metal-dependent hydrolase (beta-lactamase superfamily II)